ncbi:phosphodiester glycosidase family protein [Natronincola ferrireducens]|uniref:Phosphodiester glycosidase domain-containing protein n=1 Tax=Natronincola ferrireducens TaxID=393762 RepID=A0A1G9G769_9FIRM|nr:phosphodiester glycosidase family protein [Natronincola ferrireducens]SDK96496.1 Predicted protein [Natronincola ferrireducens]
MKKLRKALSTIGIVTVVFSSTISSAFAVDTIVYEKLNKEVLATGVNYKHIVRFDKDGWLNANVVYVDLGNQEVELDLLQSSKGVSTKETLSTMVKEKDNVVAAINGDFFYLTNPDSPLGAMVKDGEVISSPIFVHDFATLFINQSDKAFADYWKYEIHVTTDKGKRVPITTINKYTHEYQAIMLIDKNWGNQTPGYNPKHYDMVEVIVVEDEVVEVRRKQPSTSIPENGYVLLASQGNAKLLYDNFKVGDGVTVHTNIAQNNLDDIKLALGGGTLLVKNGQAVATFTQNVGGNHPRTAVGITKDRKQLILVTIDGRHNSFKGMDGRRLASLMLELGSSEAILMDGGGSTTMITRGLGDFNPQVTNHPSEGVERRIINGLAVVNQAPITELQGIKAEINEDRSFVGVSRDITVKAFDKNYNPLVVDAGNLKFSLKKGEGDFQGTKFVPKKSGLTIIEVDYLGKKTEVELRVLEELALLKVTPEQLQLTYGQSITPKLVGVDKKGYSTTINANDVVWKDEGNLGTFKNGVYTAGSKDGSTTLIATFGGKTAEIPVAIGYNKTSLGGLGNYNHKFTGYPTDLVKGRVTLDANGRVGDKALRLEYDFTQTEATRAAYIEFGKGDIVLPNRTMKLGVWVHAFENTSGWIRGHIKDAAGTRHTIDFKNGIDWTGWKYLEASIPQNIPAPIEVERIYVVETNGNNKTQGKLLFDELEAIHGAATNGGVQRETLKDGLNTPYVQKGTQFFVHSGVTFADKGNPINQTVTNRLQETINKNYELSIFTSGVDGGIVNGLKKPYVVASSGYAAKEEGDNLILYLDNRGGGLRQRNFEQWPWLMKQLNNTSKKNVFIVLPRPVFETSGFADAMEANLLKETLTKTAENNKNVFVLYGGNSGPKVDLIEGVRYIGTGNYSSTTGRGSHYIEFNIVDNQVTYQIKPLF